MLTLLLCAVLGCDQPQRAVSYGYATYQQPTYYARTVYAAVPYVQPTYQYQAPAYNASLVGSYLREEAAHRAQVEQNAKFDQLIRLLERQATAPPPPQPQFQAPPPPPQYASPQYPQAPPKSTPQFQSPPVPAPQYPAPPSQGEVSPPPFAPEKSRPSFGESAWGGIGHGSGTMANVLQARCVSCHGAEYQNKGGGYKFLEPDGRPALAEILAHKDEIIDDIRTGRMPKGGERLAAGEVMAVYTGIAQASGSLQANR